MPMHRSTLTIVPPFPIMIGWMKTRLSLRYSVQIHCTSIYKSTAPQYANLYCTSICKSIAPQFAPQCSLHRILENPRTFLHHYEGVWSPHYYSQRIPCQRENTLHLTLDPCWSFRSRGIDKRHPVCRTVRYFCLVQWYLATDHGSPNP